MLLHNITWSLVTMCKRKNQNVLLCLAMICISFVLCAKNIVLKRNDVLRINCNCSSCFVLICVQFSAPSMTWTCVIGFSVWNPKVFFKQKLNLLRDLTLVSRLTTTTIHTHLGPLTHPTPRTHTHTHTHAHAYTHTLTHARTCSRTDTHALTHRHTHAHTKSQTHTHPHPHIQTHTHARTHARADWQRQARARLFKSRAQKIQTGELHFSTCDDTWR